MNFLIDLLSEFDSAVVSVISVIILFFILSAGRLNEDVLREKFNILLMSGGLTNDDYIELTSELNLQETDV